MKDEMNVVLSRGIARTGLYLYVKRILDLCFAIVVTLAISPVLLLLALAIRLDSSGSAIYRQLRVGVNGKKFVIYKFRTMKIGTPELSTADMQVQPIKPYTRLGPLLRKTSLDELPQLFNVIRGDMSFVGPRPALLSQENVNSLRSKYRVDSLRPGITGLAQVMGRDDLDPETKVNYDRKYAENISFLTDIKILMMTASEVISARGNR